MAGGFASNIFRGQASGDEDEDVLFDINTKLEGLGEPLKAEKKATSGEFSFGFQLPQLSGFEIQGPEIRGPEIETPTVEGPAIEGPAIETPEVSVPGIGIPGVDVAVPPIDLTPIKFPEVDVTVESPDLTGFIEKAQEVTQPVVEAGAAVGQAALETGEAVGEAVVETGKAIVEPVAPVISEIANIVGEATRPVSEVVGAVTQPVGEAVATTVEAIGSALGEAANAFDGAAVKMGDGTGYGEIAIGDTGAVVDVSNNIDSIIADITAGTEAEGVAGKDIFNLATNPEEFVRDKGKDVASGVLSDTLGIDNEFAGDIVSAIDNPEEFAKTKGAEAVADFVVDAAGLGAGEAVKQTGAAAGTAATTGTSVGTSVGAVGGAAVGGGVASGVVALVEGKDAGQVAEAAAKGAATAAAVKTVSTVANAILPGTGLVIEAVAAIFQYSCYLSTSAYHHGFINMDEYLEFTRYRVNIQKDEPFATQTWLGYIMHYEPLYKDLIQNYTYAEEMYNKYTKHWLDHIKYLSGKGGFSIKGWWITQKIRYNCIRAYFNRYKEAQERRIALKGINVLGVYKRIIRIVEGAKRYANA